MVFRIEDTDKERSKKEYEEDIIECLTWLGIVYDSGPFRQSERSEIYKTYIKKLIDGGFAYVSKETPEETGATDGKVLRDEVIRFKNPNKKIAFTDLIRGEIEFDTTDLKDFVIARSMEEPLYHLTVVVDDHEMGVTHVIRGDDGISNTPRQILIQEGIGATRPLYAHIPLILASDKSKLSGRHGAVSVTEYRNKGYLPEAIINFLGLLGWNPGTEQEIFSIKELIGAFDLSKVQKSGAVFNIDKLNWFNHQYIVKLSDENFTAHASTFIPEWLHTHSDQFKRLIPVLREKINIFSEIPALFAPEGELAFINAITNYDSQLLLWKKNPDPAKAKEHLEKILQIMQGISESDFNPTKVKDIVWPYAEANGKGDVLWPVRMALTGQEKSPDPFTSASLIGKDESLKRISDAIKKLS